MSEIANKKRRVFGGKKKYDFKSVKGFLKEVVYIPFLFKIIVLNSLRKIYGAQLSSIQKMIVLGVVIAIYVSTCYEYFRLLFGGSSLR